MIEGNLNTTNLLLAIMAAVSVLQGLLLIGAGIFAFRIYRQVMQTIRDVEERQVAPLVARVQTLIGTVDHILGDVKTVTGAVTRQTERVDAAIDQTIHRVDETAGRVRASVGTRIGHLIGLVHSARAVIESVMHRPARA